MVSEKRVVITGMGAITPLGLNLETFWKSICEGKSGGRSLEGILETDGISCHIAAPIVDFNPEDFFSPKEARKNERFTQFAMASAREAWKDSGLELTEENARRIGVVFGAGIGGMSAIEEQHAVLMTKGMKRVSAMLIPKCIANMAPGMISIDLGLKGPNFCVVTACATGNHSIAEAYHVIRRGEASAIIAGGTEAAITPLGLSGFSNMTALTTRNDDPQHASRPFDLERDGFLMGEGAGALVLEDYEHARARGARIYAEMIGAGMSSDAYHITAPDPEGEGGVQCMLATLHNSGLNPEDVDYINAHGTSTPFNDKIETLAIKRSLGAHAAKVAVSSIKSMTGHLLGAAGGIEAIATAMAIHDGIIPPTINYSTPDPECDLDYVPNTAREASIRVGLSNSLGFGGHNCTIALRKFEG